MKLELYDAPLTCALVPHVTVTEEGADFEITPNARPENYCGIPGSEESVRRVGNGLRFEGFAIAERVLDEREWFVGRLTAVDAYFFWCFRRAVSFKVDLSGFPHCPAHFARVGARESVQRVLAHEREVHAVFAARA